LPNRIRKPRRYIKKLQELTMINDIDLWFEDECHFQQHGSRCAMWIPSEDNDPVVLQEPTRKSIGVFGAVRISDGCLVTSQEKTFNTMTFHIFMKKLLPPRKPDRKMVVILDNARWHHAKALTPWLTEHQDIFRLDYLPPYSADLNNIERVWKLTRKLCTHNRYFAMLEDIAETVFHQFDIWGQPNDVLRRLCAIN